MSAILALTAERRNYCMKVKATSLQHIVKWVHETVIKLVMQQTQLNVHDLGRELKLKLTELKQVR